MFNKYEKYIYSVIIFYCLWLVVIPLGFRFLAEPALNMVKSYTPINLVVEKPRLYTSIIPNAKLKAKSIKLLNKDNSVALELTRPKLNIRLLPLLSGRVHINSFESKKIVVNSQLRDKLYLGDYPIELKNQDIKAKIRRIKIVNLNVSVEEISPHNKYIIKGNDLYFKNTRKSFIFHGKTDCNFNGNDALANFDISIPHTKNLKKTKFDINISDLELNSFSDIINRCVYDEITSLEGVINIHSDTKKLFGQLDNVKINFKNPYYSVIMPDKFNLKARYNIGEDSFRIKEFTANGKGVSAEAKGSIRKIFSKTPVMNMKVNLDKSDIRVGALMLPPVITPDINIPKLKEYPFYATIYGGLKIKGKLPEPDITGNIKVEDGILIRPIPNAVSGANVNIDFLGKQLMLDVVVPAGGREVVYVSGDIMLYGDRYAHLKVRSSKSVSLSAAEFALNPIHEVFCFMIGPLPIMDVEGTGNVDIKIEGTKKDPHIWGDFNFIDTSARFLEVNNLKLEHASGNLNFNNQHAHFKNETGVLHGQNATIDGVCTLFGDIDFKVVADNQNLSDLITILTTSPMLKDIASLVPDVTDIKGKTDFHLDLRGKLLDINDLKINENIFPSGEIKLLGNSMKFNGYPVNNVKGVIYYDKTDCDFDLNAMISSASISTIKGKIKDKIADIKINSPRIKLNELDPNKLKYLDPLFITMNAHYKGNTEDIEISGIDAVINVIKDSKPVKNGKILSGKITLKNSNLNISNLNGIIKQNPFSLNINARNIGSKKLNLSKANINGNFNCKRLDLTVLNLITKAKILPDDIQKELNKVEFKNGNASISAKARNSRFDAGINVKDITLEYALSQGNEVLRLPLNIMSGNINIKNNQMELNKLNCLVDDMPVFLFGKVNTIYTSPQFDIHLHSKLSQKVFDKYWNYNNIYPVKINGDILCSANVIGNKNHTRIKSDVKVEKNSNIYYMGATIGDNQNPVNVNIDSDIDKSGWIKINKFKYNRLISSQNNKSNEVPVLIINGQIKNLGKIYALKNMTVKTENPANANFFNIIFKKPTIKSGHFTSDIKINGTSNRPKITGKFYANNMEMPYLNTSVKDMTVDFKPDNIQITTKGTVLDNYIMVNASVKNNSTPPYKINSADIYINDLDLNNSFNQLKQMELKGFSSAISQDSDVMGAEIINSLLMNNVKIRAGSIKIKNIKASGLEAICSLNERMHLSVDSFKFNMASGKISGKIKYNLLNNFMNMELYSKDVNANELCIALFDLPNQIYGSLTGHIELSCNATNDKTRLSTLSGYGNFNVANGKMPKLGSLEYLLRAGNLIKGGITGLTMNGIIDVVTPMRTGEFKSIDGRIRLKDGVAKTLEIRTLGKNLSLYVIGSLNLYTQIADMHVYGQLSRKVSTILGAAGNISLNTLFNKIPGISLDKNSQLLNDLNKIPGIELSTKATRRFMVEILGDVNGDDFVKSFKWIN